MSLFEKIKALYPQLTDAEFIEYIRLQDDSNGQGPYISKWEHPTLAQPTQEQLDGAE